MIVPGYNSLMNKIDALNLKQFFLLDPSIVFLNHGSFGATPRPVFDRYQEWQRILEFQPVEFLGRRCAALLADSRHALGEYLSVSPDDLVYVTNATTAINTVARALRLGPGDEVLATDHEYGAIDRTWRFLAARQGFKYINLPVQLPVTSVDDFVNHLFSGVTANTRVIAISHITSPTAITFPVQQVCARARQAGILTVIDGAHAPGHIPLNLSELGADFYAGNLHKWLSAPKGAAFLYAAPAAQSLIEPLTVSWGWQSENPGPSAFVDMLEWQGTRDISAFLAVPAAIKFQMEHNWAEVRSACHEMVRQTQAAIANMTGLAPLHADSPCWYAQMGASPLPPKTDIDLLKNKLYDQYRIEVPLIRWNGQPLIRYSFQVYNTEEDMNALITALHRLL